MTDMPFQVRDLVEWLRTEAAVAEQALLELATPPLVPAFAGDLAAGPGKAEPAWGAHPAAAVEAAPDQAAVLEEILALTEELDRQSRQAALPAEDLRPRSRLGALAAAGRRWLRG